MKVSWVLAVGSLAVVGLFTLGYSTAASGRQEEKPAESRSQRDQLSYGVGYYLGQEVRTGLEADGIDANRDLVVRGFADGLGQLEPMVPADELAALLHQVHLEMQERAARRLLAEDPAFKELHDRNLEAGKAYQAAFGQEEGVTTLPDGVQYKVLRPGTGATPGLDDVVVANYRTALVDGTVIDQGQEAEVAVRDVLDAGQRLLQMMKVGCKWKVALPPDQAYGSGGDPPDVGPAETLVIEVELLGVK
jgi:FKBP-type peptidyl-prolyl cis-trans isomerase